MASSTFTSSMMKENKKNYPSEIMEAIVLKNTNQPYDELSYKIEQKQALLQKLIDDYKSKNQTLKNDNVKLQSQYNQLLLRLRLLSKPQDLLAQIDQYSLALQHEQNKFTHLAETHQRMRDGAEKLLQTIKQQLGDEGKDLFNSQDQNGNFIHALGVKLEKITKENQASKIKQQEYMTAINALQNQLQRSTAMQQKSDRNKEPARTQVLKVNCHVSHQHLFKRQITNVENWQILHQPIAKRKNCNI